ncbi:MAG: phage/plasmid primase, P4 family [Solirubrobacteraceae bacterium]
MTHVTETTEAANALAATGSSFMRTDSGNAERLVHREGADLRFVPAIGWFAWDGCRWRRDDDGEVMRRAKRSARSMLIDAASVDDDEERKAIIGHAKRSESEPRLRAAVTLAQTERPVIVRSNALDSQPWLLNVLNGTLDRRTGDLREHRRDDLLTKLAPVNYDKQAASPLWSSFIAEITGGDGDFTAFLQRAVGYTLTGDVGEEVLFFAHGPAATGKSTFLEALKATLGGEYAVAADFEAFLKRRNDYGIRSDIARLAGARLVLGTEVDDGKQLAEGLVKQLTGGDTVTARFMYRDYFEFRPSFKLWLAANHRPRVNADDEAMWRRILQLPFTQVVPSERRDPELKRMLTTDPAVRSAILAWAVEGSIEWAARGLGVPQRVVTTRRITELRTIRWPSGSMRAAPLIPTG